MMMAMVAQSEAAMSDPISWYQLIIKLFIIILMLIVIQILLLQCKIRRGVVGDKKKFSHAEISTCF